MAKTCSLCKYIRSDKRGKYVCSYNFEVNKKKIVYPILFPALSSCDDFKHFLSKD